MPTNTYVSLDKITIGTATTSITFSNIPQTYTDLVLVAASKNSVTGTNGLMLRFNGDTSSNYSSTFVWGTGSVATTYRYTGQTQGIIGWDNTTDFCPTIANIQNYANSTTFKSVISRSSDPTGRVALWSNLWRKTPEAITSITITSEAGANFAVGSIFSLYGIRAEGISPSPKATGGSIYSDSTYYYHAFGSSGTFTPLQSLTCDYIVVAGGGGGGGTTGGGGGAGGFYSTTSASLSATNYSVTVGGGGAGGTQNGSSGSAGSQGSNSSFNSITRTGGGGGGTSPNVPTYPATTGGSGGGGARSGQSLSGAAGNAGSYTPVEGYAGGNNYSSGGAYGTGGGGGAGGTGQAGSATFDGAGGIGVTSSLITAITNATGIGQLVSGVGYIAGGGGGACGDITLSTTKTGASGGYGGGGKGGSDTTYAVAGLASSGSGGGGAGYTAGGYKNGINGGSGVVVIRYAKA